MKIVSDTGIEYKSVWHLRSSEFKSLLLNWVPIKYHEMVIVGIEKGYPWHNGYIEAGIDEQEDIETFVKKDVSKWLHGDGSLFGPCAFVRKDGLVIQCDSDITLNLIACGLLARKLETANRNYARITTHVHNVEDAIWRVNRPSNAMKVSVFEFLLKRSKVRGT